MSDHQIAWADDRSSWPQWVKEYEKLSGTELEIYRLEKPCYAEMADRLIGAVPTNGKPEPLICVTRDGNKYSFDGPPNMPETNSHRACMRFGVGHGPCHVDFQWDGKRYVEVACRRL